MTNPVAAASETVLDFADNRHLAQLCGEFDRHLTLIEERLAVQIRHLGNRLTIFGEEDSRSAAARLLKSLYARLEAGRTVEAVDIDRELRMTPEMAPLPPTSVAPRRRTEKAASASAVAGRVEIQTRKKLVEPRTDAQKAYVQNLMNNELAFGIGLAGTGKTYLAVAVGVSMYLGGHVDKIILSRPAVEAGERLGFLPGDMKEKVDPYMQPLYDALNDFLPAKQVQKMLEEKVIEIAPLAFMRGRTLSNAFCVLDEAQNATTMQMKMFLTRLGEGSRMVITGDRTQIDLPRGTNSGLVDAERILKGIPKISFNYFTAQDVVRHPLVAAIIAAYDSDDAS